MEAVRIFTHSLRQVFGNLGPAIKLSLLPFLVLIAAVLLIGWIAITPQGAATESDFWVLFGWGLVILVVYIACFLAVAVNWHRFILQNEVPSLIPQLHGKAMISYLVRLIVISLIAIAIIIPSGLLLVRIIGAAFSSGVIWPLLILGIGLSILLTAFFTRLSVSLPSLAIGEPITLGKGWGSMAGKWGTLIVLALIMMGLQMIVGQILDAIMLSTSLPPFAYILMMFVYVAYYWLVTMLSLSILTTLYGHYVQGRPLL